MEDELPENRKPHASDVTFQLLESGCRPAGCCKNDECDLQASGTSIAAKVTKCSEILPLGCYFYAHATANVTGSVCRDESEKLWALTNGVAFDMSSLEGWEIPSYTLWRVHNVYTEGCKKIYLTTHLGHPNKESRVVRSCEWDSSLTPLSEMLIESGNEPLSAFSANTVSLSTQLPKQATSKLWKWSRSESEYPEMTIKIASPKSANCMFRLENYFEFPKLEIPLSLLVTSTPAIVRYISQALETSLTGSAALTAESLSGPDIVEDMMEKYGRFEVMKVYLEYLKKHKNDVVNNATRKLHMLDFLANSSNHWPPINWIWRAPHRNALNQPRDDLTMANSSTSPCSIFYSLMLMLLLVNRHF